MELFRALGALVEPPDTALEVIAEIIGLGTLPTSSDHYELFDLQLRPYASIWLEHEGMLGGEARDRIAGFWRAIGQTPPAEPDHLTTMLALYATLGELEARQDGGAHGAAWRHARRAYLWEHLLSWLPVFLTKVHQVAPAPYKRWSVILREALAYESRECCMEDAPPDAGPMETVDMAPRLLPLHLRDVPPLVDPRQQGTLGEFLASVLAPVRSGMILTRLDLNRAAYALGVGLRPMTRRSMLESMLTQETGGTLAWLGDEARWWRRQHENGCVQPDSIARFWIERAQSAEHLLHDLHADHGSRPNEGSRIAPQ